MANKVLDYGAHDGAEIFDTSRVYQDGNPRAAARSAWFIDFWGYKMQAIDVGTALPTPPAGSVILVYDSNTNSLKLMTNAGTVNLVGANDINLADSPAKTAPINADSILVIDSEDSDLLKQTTFAQLKAVLTPSITTIVTGDSPYAAPYLSVILANTNGGDITVNLPDPTTIPGGTVTVKRIDAGNTLTVARNGTETIEGAASDYDIPTNLLSVTFITDGTNWWVLSTS